MENCGGWSSQSCPKFLHHPSLPTASSYLCSMKQPLLKLCLLLLLTPLFFTACRPDIEGDPDQNRPPETHTVADTIAREGEQRFTSQIEIQWWGDDPDGYITGYLLSLDGGPWIFTESQDTVLTVSIPEGQDTFNFNFRVKAVDNLGQEDPTPAEITYPVQNSAPSISFVYSDASPSRNPVRTYPVLKFTWNANDPDGFANIDHLELYLNDTTATPVIVPPDFTTATLVATDPSAPVSEMEVLVGVQDQPLPDLLQGLRTNDSNRVYIRVVDEVGATSPFIASDPIYVLPVTSDLLLVNAYRTGAQTQEDFYVDNFQQIGITSFDVLNVNLVEDDNYVMLAPDNPTQARMFELWDVIAWFGGDAPSTLPLAQKTLGRFFDADGQIFMATSFSSALEDQATFLEFTPVDSLVNPPQGAQFRLASGAQIDALQPGWPALEADRIVSSARPYFPEGGTVPLYEAEVTVTGGGLPYIWQGQDLVMVKRVEAGRTSFIFSSLELHNLNGQGNIQELFRQIFITEFNL